jgi:hypothetical protein
MIRTARKPLFVALSLSLLAVATAACATPSSSGQSSGTSTTVQPTTTTTAQVIATSTVTIDGKTYPVPTENGTDPIKPFGDTGQQVVYVSSGFLPRTLYSASSTPVVWTNLSPHPLTLSILHVGLAPVTIPVGGTYSWKPTALQFAYTSQNKDVGIVEVGAFGN